MSANAPSNMPPNAVYIFNSDLADLATLLDGLPPGAEVLLLDPARDGLAQILTALNGRNGLDALHLIGHGSSGLIDLGNTSVTTQTITERAAEFATLGSALTSSGDILLYGCDVAAGTDGQAFVNALANATGADVAASEDWTGAEEKGGDWNLEFSAGAIGSQAYQSMAYSGLLPNANGTAGTGSATGNFQTTAVSANPEGVRFEITSGSGNSGVLLFVNGSQLGYTTGDSVAIGAPNSGDQVLYYLGWTNTPTAGSYSITMTIDWGYNTTAPGVDETIVFNLTLASANSPPSAGTGGTVYVSEGNNIGPSLSNGNTGSSDSNGDTLSYSSAYTVPSNVSLAGNVNLGQQSYTVTDNKSASVTGWIYVYGVYADDSISWGGSPSNQNWTSTGTNNYGFGGASDPDTSVSYSYISGTKPSWMTVDSNGTVSGNVPPEAASQTYNLTVRASATGTIDKSFQITAGTAAQVNDLPTSTGGAQSVAEDGVHTFAAGHFNFVDLDNTAGGSTASGAALASIKIATLPPQGTLNLSGSPVAQNAVIATANIANLTYTPTSNYNGSDSFTYSINDGIADSSATATMAMTVTPVNDAPVLTSGGNNMTGITEDETNHAGQTVASIFASRTDADTATNGAGEGVGQGIAIYSTTVNHDPSTGGKWQYKVGAGSWTDIGAVTSTSALLLASTDMLRFVPDGKNGQTASFNYYAWDQSSGAAGNTVDVSTRGTTTAYSTASDAVQITISDVNDAPSIAKPGAKSVAEDGSLNITGVSFDDVDINTAYRNDSDTSNDGMSATLSVSHGTITLAGTTGISFGSGSNTSASMTITGTRDAINTAVTTLTYAPTTDYNGSDTLSIGIDDTGNVGSGGNLSANDSVAITVTPVNDAPVLTPGGNNMTGITEDETNHAGQTVASIFASRTDVDTVTNGAGEGVGQGIAIYSTTVNHDPSTGGKWQYKVGAGSWTDIGAVTSTSALLLASTDMLRFVPDGKNGQTASFNYYAWDQSSGAAGNTVDVSTRGTTTAYSTVSDPVTLTVNAVNDAPTKQNELTAQNHDGPGAITEYQVPTNTFDDVDIGDTLDYSATLSSSAALPGWLGFDTATRTFSGNPPGNAASVTVRVKATDDGNANATADFTVTLTGSLNDIPVVTNAGTALLGSITEAGHTDAGATVAGTSTATDTLSASDPDYGATQTWNLQGTPGTTYGTMAINASTGVWTYTLNNTLTATQALKEGDVVTQNYTARITDDFNAFVDQSITITINGTNDVPVVTNAGTAVLGTLTEAGHTDPGVVVAGTSTAKGTLSASDVDASATQTWSLQGTPSTSFGTMAIDPGTGVWTYTLNNTLAATQALKEGQVTSQSYTARVTDDKGAYADQTITVTINGSNDVPVVINLETDRVATLTEAGNTNSGAVVAGTSSASGSLSASDVDASATQTWSLQGTPSTTYGSIVLYASNGVWMYNLDNGLTATQALKGGEVVTQSYTARVTDDKGAYADQTIIVTINGSNDVPVVTNQETALLGTLTEAGNTNTGAAVAGTATAKGTLSASDVDADATQAWSLQGTPGTTYGTMAIDPGTGAWTYTLDNTLTATQALKAGEIVTQSYTARVTDDKGAYVDQTIVVTINGSNDTLVPTTPAADLLGTLTEAGSTNASTITAGTATAQGTLSVSDVDAAATQTWSLQGTPNTTYGTMAVNASTGVWTYTLNNTLAATQALKAGEVVTQSYMARATDDKGAFVDQTVTVTINGSNDAPVATNAASALLGTLTEAGNTTAGTATAQGTLNASDVDAAATKTWSLQGTPGTTYGTMAMNASTGVWTYTLDNTLAATQALKEVEAVTQNYTARVTDDKGAYADQTITVTINGSNDMPVANTPASALTGTLTEAGNTTAGTATAQGTLSASDVDAAATRTWSLQGTPGTTYGTMAVNASTGVWTYTLNNTLAATQALKAGEVVTQSYTARATDDKGAAVDQTMTVTINGSNDAPILAMPLVDQVHSVAGAMAPYVFADNSFTDVDQIGPLVFTAQELIGNTASALPAWLSFDASALSFSGNPPVGTASPLTIRVTATDSQGASASGNFTITLPKGNTLTAPKGDFTVVNKGTTPVEVVDVTKGATVTTTGEGPVTIKKPAGEVTVNNTGTGTVTVTEVPEGKTVTTTGNGPTTIDPPLGNVTVENTGTGTATVKNSPPGTTVTTTGNGPTTIDPPLGNVTVENTGTGTVTVKNPPPGNTVTTTGNGPTTINTPQGDVTVDNTGTGTGTVAGLPSGKTVTTTGSGPTTIDNPQGDVTVENTGTGTVTVRNLPPGKTVTTTGGGPTTIDTPQGDVKVDNTGTGTVTVKNVTQGKTVTTTGSGPTTIDTPQGDVKVDNTGTGTVTVKNVTQGKTVTTTGSGPTTIDTPQGDVKVDNTGTGTVTVKNVTQGKTVTTTGSGPTTIDTPQSDVKVDNTGTGTVTVKNVTQGKTVTTTGSGPTTIDTPQGDVKVDNTGTGTVTVKNVTQGKTVTTTGSGPTTIDTPQGDVKVDNTGTGTVTVKNVAQGKTVTTTGSGPTTIDTPQGDVKIDNTGTGTVTVKNVAQGKTVTTTGSGPTTIDTPQGDVKVDNTGTGTVTVKNVAQGKTVGTTGSGPTTIDTPQGDVKVDNTGTGTVTVKNVAQGKTVGTTGSGPTTIDTPQGDVKVDNTGTGTVTVKNVTQGKTVSTTGSGPTTIDTPQGDVKVINTGTGTATVIGLPDGKTVSISGSGPTSINAPLGDVKVDNTGTGTVTINDVAPDKTVTTTGDHPVTIRNPQGDLKVVNNGTGLDTVIGLPDGKTVSTSGSGPTSINAPLGDVKVDNTGTGTVTINDVAPGKTVTTTGDHSVTIRNPQGDLKVVNNGTGLDTVTGLPNGKTISTSGSGPTTINAPLGDLTVDNSGTGVVTVNDVAPGKTVTATGDHPVTISNPQGDLKVANNGSSPVKVTGFDNNMSLTASGSGPTTLDDPKGDLHVSNTGTGTLTLTGVHAGATVTTAGSGPINVSAPDGNVQVVHNGSGLVTINAVHDGSTISCTGSGPYTVDLSHLLPGQSVTIANDGTGLVNLAHVPAGVTVHFAGSGPIAIDTALGANQKVMLDLNGNHNVQITNNGAGVVESLHDLQLDSAHAMTMTLTGKSAVVLTETGTVALNNAPLSLYLATGYTPAKDETITLIANDGSDAVTGTFAGLPEGSVVYAGGHQFTISYVGGTGNDVVLTAIGTATNTPPTIAGVPTSEQAVAVGVAAALADFTVADTEQGSTHLNVSLTASNGTINGLVDTDSTTAGIQLTGSAATINAALAAASFTATAPGAASIAISVSDGVATQPVLANYKLTATTAIPKDSDHDQFPDALEAANGLTVGIKDNDVFTNAKFFVMQLYRDVLFREGDATGVAYWQQQIDSGHMTRAQAVLEFQNSPEFHAGAGGIERLYFAGTGHMPEVSAISAALDQVHAGTSLAQLAQGVAASADFAKLYGQLSNTAYVDALYQHVLQRPADVAGALHWVGQLDAGTMSRSDVLLKFTDSNEYRQANTNPSELSVALDYMGLLGRAPDKTGFDFWVNQQNTPLPDVTIIGGFITSAEFHDRFMP